MATTKSTTTKKSAVKRPAASAARKSTASKKVTELQIRKRAEEIYSTRVKTGIPGDATSDWLQAERELHSVN
jgi:hypothetical protein